MKQLIKISVNVLGWLLIFMSILLNVLGVSYGITETEHFYARQDEYHSRDTEREAYCNMLDSLKQEANKLNDSDSIAITHIENKIDSLQNSETYTELFGEPAPPTGFSLAGLVSVIVFIFSLIPLCIGILIVVLMRKKDKITKKE